MNQVKEMTTILALSDTCLADGHLHSMITNLAGEADLVLHAGDFTSQAAYNALKNACKSELWAVYGKKDPKGTLGNNLLKDSNGNLIPKFKSETKDDLKIYLENHPLNPNDYSEIELMKYAEHNHIDLMVFGHFNKPIIAWGKKDEASGSSAQLLVCPGSSSAFKSSFPTVVRINVSAGKINDVELISIPPVNYQNRWRICSKCKGLFFAQGVEESICPEGGKHSVGFDPKHLYSLAHDTNASGQRDWRWCGICQGLYFGPNIKKSICPKGGNHIMDGSGRYTIINNNPNAPGQADWRWCGKCQGLFYGPSIGESNCPAGGKHVSGSKDIKSGNYTLESQ
jgi:predicted phosphodiesterase